MQEPLRHFRFVPDSDVDRKDPEMRNQVDSAKAISA
jgi:hypothetical protein